MMQLKTVGEYKHDIANTLRQYRLRMNITQQELAERIGVNVNTIRRIESSGDGTLATFVKILAHYGKAEELSKLLPSEPVIDLYKSTQNKQRIRAGGKS
jgi:transcriptional regulator with XRE-family HTH domain